MTWQPFYVGDGTPRDVDLGDPPPWRSFPRQALHQEFQPPPGLGRGRQRRAGTAPAAAGDRRPGLRQVLRDRTGRRGAEASASVLRWHITSRSTLADALYRYDAAGPHPRTAARRTRRRATTSAPFLQLGPLGTALLPVDAPRALLIDEIDKSDLDLPSDLLNVLEHGEFEIPELARYARDVVRVREWAGDEQPAHGPSRRARAVRHFPFVVLTSNGERDFPAAFLRRCVRFTMPMPSVSTCAGRGAHLQIDEERSTGVDATHPDFVERLAAGERLAVRPIAERRPPADGGGTPRRGGPARCPRPGPARAVPCLRRAKRGRTHSRGRWRR